MPRFVMWYKKTVDAKDLNQAIKLEKKTPLAFHSIEQDNRVDQERLSCVGFTVSTESDYDEDE